MKANQPIIDPTILLTNCITQFCCITANDDERKQRPAITYKNRAEVRANERFLFDNKFIDNIVRNHVINDINIAIPNNDGKIKFTRGVYSTKLKMKRNIANVTETKRELFNHIA